MPLTSGTRLGPYEILAPLGAGGMGEVYRARDERLRRHVAIKVLPDIFSADTERMHRFEQEALALASLNHPNIATIYGIEGSAIVMELVEGETLAERLAHGPLSVEEALGIARQIANALGAAHGAGIIHRDLKPANVKVTGDGKVKLLDFGLARVLVRHTATAGGDSGAQTATVTATVPGFILGTAAYMSPEQARGLPVDKRADIWAFGCVLYELLTAKRAFQGANIADTLSAVLTSDPDWSILPAFTPEAAARLLRRCLRKDPDRRLHDAADARLEVDDALAASVQPPVKAAAPGRSGLRPWIVAAIATAISLLLGYEYFRDRTLQSRTYHSSIMLPHGWTLAPGDGPAISPDGKFVALAAANTERKSQIWIRSVETGSVQPLASTDGGRNPFWSPDSSSIGFFADGALKTAAISGGASAVLCPAPSPRGGAWAADGIIVYAPQFQGPLHRVAARGGDCNPFMAPLEKAGPSPRWPDMLPGNRRFLYWSAGAVYLGSIDSKESFKVWDSPSSVLYRDGHLLFVRGTSLMAQRFDLDAFKLAGEPVRIADRVLHRLLSRAMVSASSNGLLVYQTGAAAETPEVALVDRTGQSLQLLDRRSEVASVAFSPGGTSSVLEIKEPDASSNVWLYDIGRNIRTRLTFQSRFARSPVWSPDGRRLVFTAVGAHGSGLYVKNADGSGDEELLFTGPNPVFADTWSPDGRQIVFQSTEAKTRHDLWILPLAGERTPHPYLRTPFAEHGAHFSPDGKWIAFVSDQSGSDDVYAAAFPYSGNAYRISKAAVAAFPRWSRDGRRILYLDALRLQVVETDVEASHNKLSVGETRPVFEFKPAGRMGRAFDVSPDGKRFIVIRAPGSTEPDAVHLVVNWPAMLKR